jgi:hypothetical protein
MSTQASTAPAETLAMATVKEQPILMCAEMVRAILEGRKTQTRRVIKGGIDEHPDGRISPHPYFVPRSRAEHASYCPHGVPGDRLWIRESFRLRMDQDEKPPSQDWWKSGAWYEADGLVAQPSGCAGGAGKLRPGIFMPRWASRITLEITDVRVQRVQEISEGDAGAEGCKASDAFLMTQMGPDGKERFLPVGHSLPNTTRGSFAVLWDSINAQRGFGWETNCWIWAIKFRKLENVA